MDVLWTSGSLVSNSYLNISLLVLLRTCPPPQQPLPPALTESDEDAARQPEGDASFSLNKVVDWFVGAGGMQDDVGHRGFGWESDDDCDDLIRTHVGGAFSLINVVVGVVVFTGLSLFLLPYLWRKRKGGGKKETSEDGIMTMMTSTKESQDAEETPLEAERGSVSSVGSVFGITTSSMKLKAPTVIPLASSSSSRGLQRGDACSFVLGADSGHFLRHTVAQLSAELDWVLGVTAAQGDPSSPSPTNTMSATASSLITPRLQRRGGVRRPRWRTLTSLDSADQTQDDKTAPVRLWQRVCAMERRMGWCQEDWSQVDISDVQDGRLSTVLQFYQQTCPVRAEQWSASCLIANYVLALLELELTSAVSDRSPLKVLELRSFGSAASQTCIGRANRFNVMLVLQLPFCWEMSVYDCEVCDDIPAGRLVLGVKELGGTASSFVQKDRIGDYFGSFLCAREVVKASQRLLINAMDRLKLKNKSLLDRLPFTLHVDQYNDLQICIDTRIANALGLGLSDIKLRLTPALRVSSEELNPLPAIYAVPPWNAKPLGSSGSEDSRSRVQSRIMRSHNYGVPGDLLWQLDFSELTKAFMSSARGKLASAGVKRGCQAACQQVLRAAFSHSGKDTLLTAGEIHPHVLDSIVFFLLLESPACAWNLSNLPDRFSDCVHFLRSAVQSCWMPGFLLHNPHLLKQMPALELLPLLKGRRQENLLGSLGAEDAEGVLSFLEARLQETGLRRCVKEDYSTEMWEYEFFIFG